MKPKNLLYLFLVAISVGLLSGNALSKDDPLSSNFTGVVVDKAEGVAITRAHIWIHEDTGKRNFASLPDRQGHFAVQLPDGYYDVLFSASGFAPVCKKIWIRTGHPIKLNAHMEPDLGTSQVD